jgi:hypothetical protein
MAKGFWGHAEWDWTLLVDIHLNNQKANATQTEQKIIYVYAELRTWISRMKD